MLTWQITEMIQKYLSHPVDTKVDIQFSKILAFPAVTICNMNPIVKSKLSATSDVQLFETVDHVSVHLC